MKSSEKVHAGTPHFHVKYEGYEASFSINPCHKFIGEFPTHRIGTIVSWTQEHQLLLINCWNEIPDIIKIGFPY